LIFVKLKKCTASSNIQKGPDTTTSENHAPIDSTTADNNVRSQVTQFTDQDPGWGTSVPTMMDSTRDSGLSDNTALGQFLQRPIHIWSQTWVAGTPQKCWVFDPWYLFLSNPQVEKKIATYRMFQGSLHVKFVINANGFTYGNMMAYYHPLVHQDSTAGYPSITSVDANGIVPGHGTFNIEKQHLVRHSQKPHIFLLPQTSTGGTLELPFLWYENWLDLTAEDADKLGKIVLCQLNEPKVLSITQAARISITAYAWMENAKLSLSTTMEHKLSASPYKIENSWPNPDVAYRVPPQSSAKNIAQSHAGDEYGTGPISKVANSVALASDSLSQAPVIGPYARASSLIASGVGRLASLFGYSRPTVINNITPYKPIYLGNLANTDAGDTSQKLTLDSKQEVSIDPRVVGLQPKDEMTIRSIAGRESYFTTITWGGPTGTSGSIMYTTGKRLMNCLVTPMLRRTRATTNSVDYNKNEYNLTGCCYAALPFGAWRGTMRYRFQIIASQFHRGRIRIVWDPRKIMEQNLTTGSTTTKGLWETSNIMSCIVDLADNRDFTVDVGWGQTTTYMPSGVDPGNHLLTEDSIFITTPNGDNTSLKDEWGNGVIGIYIVNELVATATGTTGSLETSPVYINMFVSCPDLDVANPEEAALQRWSAIMPMGLKPATNTVAQSHSGFDEVEPDHAPTSPGSADFTLGPPIKPLDQNTSNVFYGDPIVSFRTLMKRYCYHMALLTYHKDVTANDQGSIIIYTLPDYPQAYGTAYNLWAPLYMSTNPGDNNKPQYGWCPAKHSWLSFYSLAYACRRGGIRWKYLYKPESSSTTGSDKFLGSPPSFVVTRGTWPAPKYDQRKFHYVTHKYEKLTLDYANNMPTGEGGLFVTNTDGNPVVEVELPFYCLYRFLTTKQADYAAPGPQYSRESIQRNLLATHTLTCILPGNKNNAEPILSFVAAADDYSLHMYLGPPRLFHVAIGQDFDHNVVDQIPYGYL